MRESILQTHGVLTQEYCVNANINLNEMEYGGRSLGSISTTYQLKKTSQAIYLAMVPTV